MSPLSPKLSPLSRKLVSPLLAVSLCFVVSACMASGPGAGANASANASASQPDAAQATPHDPAAVEAAPPQAAPPAMEQAPMASPPSDPQSPSNSPRAHVGEPVGNGPFGQFIVKYRDDSKPLTQQGAVQPRLDQTAARAGLSAKAGGLKLTWKHRMGINADVFSVSPALDRASAQRLMQTFADDPDVQFIEPDNHIALDPIIRGPVLIEK